MYFITKEDFKLKVRVGITPICSCRLKGKHLQQTAGRTPIIFNEKKEKRKGSVNSSKITVKGEVEKGRE